MDGRYAAVGPIFRRFDNGLLHQTSLISIPQTELNKVLGDGIPATSFAAGRNETSGVSGNYNYQNEDGTPNGWPRRNGDVAVLDDATGHPIEGVRVTGYFTVDIGWRAWTESPIPNKAESLTDKRGLCSVSGKTNCGKVGCWVENPPNGYYCPPRGWRPAYTSKDLFGVWQPDNLVATIRLQRVEHPIPLSVKRVELRDYERGIGGFDDTNAVLRYDLVLADWLPPVGHGKVADLTMETCSNFVERVKGGIIDFDCYERCLSVALSGVGNGIVPLAVKPTDGIKVRQAPEAGYAPAVMKRFGRRKSIRGVVVSPKMYSDEDPNRCYVFRIRSQYDEKGNLVEAYYGKIYGDFNFSKV